MKPKYIQTITLCHNNITTQHELTNKSLNH